MLVAAALVFGEAVDIAEEFVEVDDMAVDVIEATLKRGLPMEPDSEDVVG